MIGDKTLAQPTYLNNHPFRRTGFVSKNEPKTTYLEENLERPKNKKDKRILGLQNIWDGTYSVNSNQGTR